MTDSRPTPPPVRAAAVVGTRKQSTNSARPSRPAGSRPRPQGNRRPRGGGGGKPRGRGRGRSSGIHFGPPNSKDIPTPKQPPRNPDGMYLLPLGGLEEIGRNAAAVEYKGDIVIIDLG